MHIRIDTFTNRYIPYYLTSIVLMLLLFATPAYPQSPEHPWYVSREMGMPIYYGNIKTLLQEQHPSSLEYGLSCGYKLHRLFDIELSIDYGNSRLTARSGDDCYFLDRNGNTYSNTQVSGTVPYAQIYALLKYVGLGLHTPIYLNRLFFPQSKPHRLSLLFSPNLSVSRYSSKIRLKYSHQTWLPPQIHWSFEMGTDLLLRYNLSRRIDFQLSTGIKYICNKKFDGLSTSSPHNASYVWNTGLSMIYKFGKKTSFYFG